MGHRRCLQQYVNVLIRIVLNRTTWLNYMGDLVEPKITTEGVVDSFLNLYRWSA